MIQIKTKGEPLDLPEGFSIEIEQTNPVYNERGSQTIPATVPVTRRNMSLLDSPCRIDAGSDPKNPDRVVEVVQDAYTLRGIMNITEAGLSEGITFNIGFDNSTAYASWQQKKLKDLSTLPVYKPDDGQQGYKVDLVLDYLYRIYRNPNPQNDDLAVFPVAVNCGDYGEDSLGQEVKLWEILNVPGWHGLAQPTKVNRIIDGTVTEVSIPEGYCVSPFVRVWKVLEIIFADQNLEIVKNPFRERMDLARLVILNNAADSVCRGVIDYADLMPDVTVEEFFNALWVRFGLVYNIDYNSLEVRLELLDDMIAVKDAPEMKQYATAPPKIVYEQPQYVKLSAKTTIDGAAPATERLEDFVKGLDVSDVKMGNSVSQWQNIGTPSNPKWDGDVRYDWSDRDDYDDGYPDADTESGQSASANEIALDTFLAREFVTGLWYKLDAKNGTVKESSTSFFEWNPNSDGVEPFELDSDDEFVPVRRVSNTNTSAGNAFNDFCPAYMFGARHYHSYIIGDESENDGTETPLAFMFAFSKDGKSFGRFSPEGDNGRLLTLDDGDAPSFSLLFQFKDGLFAKFWKYYDEILRHGSRYAEIQMCLPKQFLYNVDLLKVYSFWGIRCLIDKISYSLPSGDFVPATVTVRPVMPYGTYDIDKEQQIPEFATGVRQLKWKFVEETFGMALDTVQNRSRAADKYKAEFGYESHQEPWGFYDIGPGSVRLKKIERVTSWENDTLPKNGIQGDTLKRKYLANMYYDVYESYDTSTDPESPGEIVFVDKVIGQVEINAEYEVTLVSDWVFE